MAHYGGRAEIHRLAGRQYEVDRCTHCGLIFQRTVPTGALLIDLYDRWISKAGKGRHGKDQSLEHHRYLAAQIDFVVQHLDMKPSEIEMFDFGFGWAEWALIAQSFGCNVSGTELSPELIRHAKSLGINIIDWENIPQRRYHFINTEQVFEHLIEPRLTLEHLVNALHPNGIMKISVPNGRGIAAKLRHIKGRWPGQSLMPIAPLEHINCFDASSLKIFGESTGLKSLRPSLKQLYNASSGWFEPLQAARNLLRPIYRHIYPKSTFAYFVK